MNTIEFFRNNCVDYTNQTQNEPRYNKYNKIDDIIYYPLGFTYYNKYDNNLVKLPILFTSENTKVEEKWFLDKLYENQIEYAIKFLQVEALKMFIIKNFKSLTFQNPFNILFNTYYPVDKNIDSVKEIIQILIDNYDDYHELINNLSQPNKSLQYIMDLLYEFLPDEPDNVCSLCLSTEPKKCLINICNCITKTHINCLIELNKYRPLNQYKCSVCNSEHKVNQDFYGNKYGLFFPHNDMYGEPLMSSTCLHKYEGMDRLKMAIIYLQVNRVKELLNEKEILDNLFNYYLHQIYQITPIHSLCTGNLCSNAYIGFGDNHKKYYDILKLLLETNKFDLTQKDIFNKTPMDYTIKNNLPILKLLLEEYI